MIRSGSPKPPPKPLRSFVPAMSPALLRPSACLSRAPQPLTSPNWWRHFDHAPRVDAALPCSLTQSRIGRPAPGPRRGAGVVFAQKKEDEANSSSSNRTTTTTQTDPLQPAEAESAGQGEEEDTFFSAASMGGGLLSEREVCDEFVCTSSPVVASHVRQIVKDIQDGRDLAGRAASYIAEDIEYSDNWMSLKGRSAYVAHNLWSSGILQPGRPRILSLTMLATDTFEVKYAVSNVQLSTGGLEASLRVCETFVFNLISGRAIRQSVRLDVVEGGPLASICLSGTKFFSGLVAKGGQLLGQPGSDGAESDENKVFVDPRDPNRFFYQEDQSFNDAVQIAIGITAVYAVVQALKVLF